MKHYLQTLVFFVGFIAITILDVKATPDAGLADFLARPAYYNSSGNAYPYRLFVPDGYNLPENATRQYPIVLFLHGLGERGTNNSSQVTGAGAPVLGLVTGTNRDSYPAFILCPQIPTSVEWGWGDSSGGVVFNTRQMIEILRSEFRVDSSRISVSGLSLGAMGTWSQLQVFPNYYAAALPMSWSNTGSNAGSAAILAQTSLWVFYGDQDSYRYSNYNDPANDVNTTRAVGGYVVFSRYPDGTHGTNTWGTAGNTRGFYTPGLMQWLTGQQKGVANTTQAPLISLTAPTTGLTYTTASTALNLTGTASDAMGGGVTRTISGLTWTNDRGGNGTATGTTSWLANGIVLQSGSNKIQLLATDNQNTTFNRLLTVTQSGSPTNQAPAVNAGPDRSVTLPASASLSGSVTDDGVAPGNSTPTAAWSKVSGPGTVTFSPANTASTSATFSVAGTYVVRLTGSDGVLSTTDDATVTVAAGSDTTAPTLTVTSPTTGTTYSTAATSLNLGGTAADNTAVTAVTWTNSRGGSGTAVGTTSWSITGVTLLSGTNVLTVTAKDAANNSVVATLTVTCTAPASGPQPVRFDFGGTVATNNGAATAGNWNNVNDHTAGLRIANAIDASGASTGYSLSITASFNNLNWAGSTSTTGLYPATAMQDSFFVQDAQVAKVKLQGFNPSSTYSLVFFASRMGGGTNRVTAYKVGTLVAILDATDNTANSVVLANLVPAADGSIEIEIKNNTGSGYGYLGVLEIQSAAPHVALFDFGGTVATSNGAATAGNWNNINDHTVGVKISNVIDANGVSSGYSLSITSPFDNLNWAGSTSTTGIYPATAMQDSFFVLGATVAKIKLSGLAPATKYALTFFASRMGGGTNRVTAYTIGTTTVTLDATDNTSQSVSISNISPASDGTIEVSIQNSQNSGYGYMGVLELGW